MRNPQRMIVFVIFFLLTIFAVLPHEVKADPQNSQVQQNQSVVDAARRSREQKKNVAQPARIFTNDDLDTQHSTRISEDLIIGGLAAPQTESPNAIAAAAEAPDQTATLPFKVSGTTSKESEEAFVEDAEIAKLKSQLASAQNELNLQRRQLLLDQNTIYTNPAYTATHAGKAELDSAKLQIEQLQEEVDRLKQPLADLEWNRWRRMQNGHSENGSADEGYKSVPPSALVLPQP